MSDTIRSDRRSSSSGKTYRPEPLVYFAAVLERLGESDKARAFVDWLLDGAQPIFRQYFYDPPSGATPLRA